MAITESIVLDDQVSAAAESAAAAVDSVAHSFAKAKEATVAANAAMAKYSATAAAAEAAVASGAQDAAAAQKEVTAAALATAKAVEKAALAERKAANAKAAADSKAKRAQEKATKEQAKFAQENSRANRAVQLLGSSLAAVGTVAGFGKVAFDLANTAASLIQTERAATSSVNILTKGGRLGQRTVEGLKKLASGLGKTFAETAGEFAQFREAGLDNRASVAMIKLRADVEAIAPGAGLSEKAVKKVLDRIAKGEDAAAAMAAVAKEFGVVGDGANATAIKAGTLDGRLASLNSRWAEMKTGAAEAANAIVALQQQTDISKTGMINSALDGASAIISGEVEIQDKDSAFDAGLQMAQDFASGIDSGAGSAASSVSNMVGGALNAIKSGLDMHSPSKVMIDLATNAVDSFAMPFDQAEPAALPVPEIVGIGDTVEASSINGAPMGGDSVTIAAGAITIVVQAGASESATAREVERQIQRTLNRIQRSGGLR